MKRLRAKARSARDNLTTAQSHNTPAATPQAPQETPVPQDSCNTHGVTEGLQGDQPYTSSRDFAEPVEPTRISEPPTSLQSSIDAGAHVPKPSRYDDPSSQVSYGTLTAQARARRCQPPNRTPHIALRQPSIGIRRILTPDTLRQKAQRSGVLGPRPNVALPPLEEEQAPEQEPTTSAEANAPEPGFLNKFKRAVRKRMLFRGRRESEKSIESIDAQDDVMSDYTSDMVDILDTLDPEIATLTSLTNMQNSLFIPNIPWFNRRPTYNFRRRKSETDSLEEIDAILQPMRTAQAQAEAEAQMQARARPQMPRVGSEATMATVATINSRMSDSRFAVLPHGTSLEGWSKEDKKEVNDHVRHMLHSKRSRFKRTMRGFGQYVRRPLGFLVTLYATLITIFGLAWVLFLIGWINVGGKQIYVVHVIDSVLVALFAVVGDGLAPFRAVDTYHMIFIAHYHHFTWSRRKRENLPELDDHNDLPTSNAPISEPRFTNSEDPEKQWEFTVLTPKQQQKLEHHQAKFCKSHSFYKPHETETHHAFPLRLLVAIVVLLDCHSLLQISLGATTWGIYYKHRNPAITTVILTASIACNATAGLIIWIGDKRTRKTDVLERMNRQELTEEAIEMVKKKKERDSESEREDMSETTENRKKSFEVIRKDTLKSLGRESGERKEGGASSERGFN